MDNADATAFVAGETGQTGSLKRPRRRTVAQASVAQRYFQVLLTYPRRWHFRIGAILLAGYLLALFTIPSDVSSRSTFLLVDLTAVAAILTAMLIEQAKEQLADARAALTPHFRVPHIIVFVIMMLGAVILLPLISSPSLSALPIFPKDPMRVRFSAVGVVAFVALCSMAIGWCRYSTSIYTLIPLAGLLSVFASHSVRQQLLEMLTGTATRTAAGVLAVALSLLAFCVCRLLTINEEDPEWRRATTNWRFRAAMTGDASLREASNTGGPTGRAARFVNRLAPIESLMRHVGRSLHREPPGTLVGSNSWWRVRHYRLVSLSGWRPAALALAMMAVLAVLVSLVALNDRQPSGALQIAAGMMTFIATCIPGVIVGFIWPRRWLTASYEAMLPTARRRFVAESGIAMLLDLMTLWLTCQIAVWVDIALISFLSPADGPRFESIDAGDIVPAVSMLASPQLLVFALLVAAMRARSALLSMAILFPIAVVPVLPVMLAQALSRNLPGSANIVIAQCVVAATGIVLAALAMSIAVRNRSLGWCLFGIVTVVTMLMLQRPWLQDSVSGLGHEIGHDRAALVAGVGLCVLVALLLIALAYRWWCEADFE